MTRYGTAGILKLARIIVLTYMPVWFLQEDSNQHIVMEKKLSTETRGSLKLFNNRAKIPIIIHPLVLQN